MTTNSFFSFSDIGPIFLGSHTYLVNNCYVYINVSKYLTYTQWVVFTIEKFVKGKTDKR